MIARRIFSAILFCWLALFMTAPAHAILSLAHRTVMLVSKSPPPSVLPANGLVGLWNAANYSATPITAIPGSISPTPVVNYVEMPRRNFAVTYYFQPQVVTVVDANATGWDGSGDATSVTSASAVNWSINHNSLAVTLSAGTYTACIWVRWKDATGDPNFRFGIGVVTTEAGMGAATAPDFLWHRYCQAPLTLNGATSMWFIPILRPASGNTQANFEIMDYDIYKSSTDLATNDAGSGNIIIGHTLGQTAVTHDSQSVSFLGATGGGMQLPASFNAFTVFYIAKTNGSPTNVLFNAMLSKMAAASGPFGVGVAVSGNWGLTWNSVLTTLEQGTGQNFEPQNSYSLVAISYDRATAKAYVNGRLITSNTIAGANLSFRDLWVGMYQLIDFSNYQLADLVLYNRALTDAEVLSGSKYLINTSGISLPFTRRLIGEGDSITHGSLATNDAGYWYVGHPSLTKISHGPNLSVPGSTMTNVSARSAAVDAQIAAALAAGQQPVVYLMDGYNDLAGGSSVATLEANIIAYVDARRANGAKVVLGTILPSQSAAAIAAGLNVSRATFNSDILAWVGPVGTGGKHIDAIADIASDATCGPDAAPNNASFYAADKIHPTTLCHADLAVEFAAGMNALP